MRILFIFIFVLTFCNESFAEGCSDFTFGWPGADWQRHVTYFDSLEGAASWCQNSSFTHGAPCGPCTDSANCGVNVCQFNLNYYACWVNDWSSMNQYFAVWCAIDPCLTAKSNLQAQCGASGYTMTDEDNCIGHCNDCASEAEEQCGDREVEWNNDGECSYRCKEPCQDLIDLLSWQCGGSDKFWVIATVATLADGSTSEKCEGACGTRPDGDSDTDGDGTSDKNDPDIDGDGIPNGQDPDMDGDGIPNQYDSAPSTPGGVDTSKSGSYGGGNHSPTGGSDPGTPPDPYGGEGGEGGEGGDGGSADLPTFDCYEAYNRKKRECELAGGRLATWDNTTCTGTCTSDEAKKCASKEAEAEAVCRDGYIMLSDCSYTCYMCSAIEQKCIDSCRPANVKTNFCEESNGRVVDSLCECDRAAACDQYRSSCIASCSQTGCGGVEINFCQEDSTGRVTSKECKCKTCDDPELPPPDNPEPGPGDPSEPVDNGDIVGWLQSIKRDTGTIADNTYATKQSIDGLKDALSNVTIGGEGLSVTVGDSDLGNSGSITGAGYGEVPKDDDLPENTSFGEFKPRTDPNDDYSGQVANLMSGLSVSASGVACNLSFSVPIPSIHGLSLSISWRPYALNFCQFESVLASVGSILVFSTALRELYKFSV